MSSKIILMLRAVSLFFYANTCCAQELHIGNQVPDLSSNSVINHTSSQLRLSDIKKKWILLDFWSTTCASCVASFEKIDKLQEKFDKDLQVVFINREKQIATVDFFKKKVRLKKAKVPYITEDSIFRNAFPHAESPYYVLLDSNRKVVAFPDHAYVSNDPVEDLVKNNRVNFGQIATSVKIKEQQSLLSVLDSANFSKAQSYFILVKGVDGLARYGYEKNRFILGSVPFKTLFTAVMTELKRQEFTREAIVIETKNRDSLVGPSDPLQYAEWLKQNQYAVDILVNPKDRASIINILKDNLERHFGIEVSIEKRRVPCFVLKQTDQFKDISTRGGQPSRRFQRTDSTLIWSIVNKPFSELSSLLKEYFDAMVNTKPFVDGSGLLGNVDMTVDVYFFEKFQKITLDDINSAISKYGLIIAEEDNLADVVIIRDRK